jgi:hypothetical protein
VLGLARLKVAEILALERTLGEICCGSMGRKRALYVSSAQDGISDAIEGDEERIALSVDLPPLMVGE